MMNSLFQREPVAVVNTISGLIEAGLALAIAFGLALSTQQVGAIMAFVVALGACVRVLLVRPQVTPIAKLEGRNGQLSDAVEAESVRLPNPITK